LKLLRWRVERDSDGFNGGVAHIQPLDGMNKQGIFYTKQKLGFNNLGMNQAESIRELNQRIGCAGLIRAGLIGRNEKGRTTISGNPA
jgi:hypothetical protein